MRKTIALLAATALIACAEVPYDENGLIQVPPTANFAMQAQPAAVDRALEELRVRIVPGAEEARVIAAVAFGAIVLCRVTDCRRGGRGSRGAAGAITIAAGDSSEIERLEGQLKGLQSTQAQVERLADLSEALAVMAERDSAALATVSVAPELPGWIALYQTRKDTLQAARDGAVQAQTSIPDFIERLRTNISKQAFLSTAVDLNRQSASNIARVNASIARLDVVLTEMTANASR